MAVWVTAASSVRLKKSTLRHPLNAIVEPSNVTAINDRFMFFFIFQSLVEIKLLFEVP